MKLKCEKFIQIDQKEFEVDNDQIYDDVIINIDTLDQDPEGFSLYCASTLAEVFSLSSQKLMDEDISLLTRKYLDLELNHLALLYKTNYYCFVFRDDPKQCEFYNIDYDEIELVRRK